MVLLQVGHYIYSINDKTVLDLNWKEVAQCVVNSNGYMNIVVFEHVHDYHVL